MTGFSAVNETARIRVPIFCVVGEMDTIFCTPPGTLKMDQVINAERKYYLPETELEVFILPQAGHSINLQYNAFDWYKSAIDWTKRKMH